MDRSIIPINKDGNTVKEESGIILSPSNNPPIVFGEETKTVSADLGYNIIGPLCYGFAAWLAVQARCAGIEHIYFLSRDGWLLKKAFDLLPEESRAGLTSHYLYSSRRAVWFASLDENTPEKEFYEILSGAAPYLPVHAFLTRIFLEPQTCIAEIREAGFADENTVIENASDKRRLRKLFRLLRPRIEQQAAKEREDYLAYLKHSGFFQQHKVALADVGWTGSVLKYTRALAQRVDEKMDVHAYFIGVGRMAEKKYGFEQGTCLHGYLFDFDDDTHRQILKSFYVIEKFLSPNEPSLVKITRDKRSGFKPVYKAGQQEVSPLNFIVQNSALRFIKDNARPHHLPDTGSFVPALEKLLTRPDKDVANLLSQYSYSSDFGYAAGAKPIAYSQPASNYLRNPLQLFKDYRRARWKAGFVAQQPWPARMALRLVRKTQLDHVYESFVAWVRQLR